MSLSRPLGVALLCAAATVSACKSSTEPKPPVVSQLTCADPGGTISNCTLDLTTAGGFTITLTRNECAATGNVLYLTSPVADTLSTDACHATRGTVWTFGTPPLAAGTQIGISIQSPQLTNPPALRVEGAYPTWTVNFEDGADSDFNDLVLTVQATT